MIATATLTWLALALADEPTVTLERIDALHADAFVGEPVGLRISMSFDDAFLDEQLVSLFRRPLDLPVELVAPWLAPNALPVEWLALPTADAATSFVLNGAETRASMEDDAGQRTYTLERWFVVQEPGRLELSAPELRYAFATSFRDDLVSGRVPEDRREAVVAGTGLELGVRPRPPAPDAQFDLSVTGPVDVSVAASRLDADVGEVFTLALTLRGDLPLHGCALPPALSTVDGFDIVGSLLSAPDATTRTIAIDLARRDVSTRVIPAFELSAFDPTPPEGHRRLRTEPIELDVPATSTAPAVPESRVPSGAPEPQRSVGNGVPWLWVVGGVVLGWLIGRVRRRPAVRARVASVPTAARAASRESRSIEARLLTALSARTGLSDVALIRPDLGDTLIAAGLDADVSCRAEQLVEQIVAARYGGEPLDEPTERRIDELISEIETF